VEASYDKFEVIGNVKLMLLSSYINGIASIVGLGNVDNTPDNY
jgi:hypothetical protein